MRNEWVELLGYPVWVNLNPKFEREIYERN
jgi:hypothetical protein